ncbi:MAG: YqaJ viral recombinase family protein [Bacteroidales bacterium]|nr:YqaJ viral recombinase family protein [Bacteroidales bacterium]
MDKLIAISTVGMSREDWLRERKLRIGGSDAGPIVGMSAYSSPYSVWADKTGRLPEKDDTEAMRIGRDLEQYVAERWSEETGKRVQRRNAILVNPKYDFAHANVDRLVIGEDAGLECKTTSMLNVKHFKDGVEFPDRYYCQCVHYLAVTGAQRWYLAVLVLGEGLHIYTLERDEDEIRALMDAERAFYEAYIKTDCPPPVDGTIATGDAIGAIYRGGDGGTVALIGRDSLIREYTEIKANIKEQEKRLAEIENIIKSDIGDADGGECAGFKVSWKPQTRKNFDVKRYAADNPAANLEPYYNVSSSRPFKVTAKKN